MPDTYYRVSGFNRAVVQTVNVDAIVETRLFLAQKASADASNTDLTWEGDNQKITQRILDGMTVQLDLDAVPASAHATIFGKGAAGGALPAGMSAAQGYGGGNDVRGVSCGLRLEGNAIKVVDGVETAVTYTRWFPMGTLTLLKPSEFQTSAKAGQTQYSFTPVRTAVDLLGDDITGASADGEFFYDGEIA